MEHQNRIELISHPYQGRVINHYTTGAEKLLRVEESDPCLFIMSEYRYDGCCLILCRKSLFCFLHATTAPTRNLVPPAGIEPTSYVP